jgi:hypothetical protein
MCLFYADFKHFRRLRRNIFRGSGKVSSSIRANRLSIMAGEAKRLTSLVKRIRTALWHGLPIDREHNSGVGEQAVRRQFGVGGAQPVGSGCTLQPDPLSLPVSFEARDGRADGGVRRIEINRDRVVVKRAVRGMRMAINVCVRDFLGIACRDAGAGQALVLVHRDPSLSVPLLVTSDDLHLELAWQTWSELFALPQIEDESGDTREPALRRRRRNAIRSRRPQFLVRRKAGQRLGETSVHRAEREIIARN